MIFYDGLLSVFVFSGIYAAGIFNWSSSELAILGIMLFMTAALGAFPGGWVDDKIGSKKALFISVGGIAIATLGLISIDSSHVLFVIEYGHIQEITNKNSGDLALFASWPEKIFLIFSAISGFFTGPALASSRTMVARLAPRTMMTQFFGLYSLMGRATAFLAPFAIGTLTAISNSQRIGFSAVLLFMAVGLALLILVREERAPESGI
jgi:UMF1 family MFS transporter